MTYLNTLNFGILYHSWCYSHISLFTIFVFLSCDIICGRNSVQLLSPNISKEFNEYYFGKKKL